MSGGVLRPIVRRIPGMQPAASLRNIVLAFLYGAVAVLVVSALVLGFRPG